MHAMDLYSYYHAPTLVKGNVELGFARYYDTADLMHAILSTPKLVKLMDFTLRADNTSTASPPRVHALFSVDGAALNSSTGTVLGFVRILNMVDYVDSPLMQYPLLMAATSESRSFYAATLPKIFSGFSKLTETGVRVICVDDGCTDRLLSENGHHYHK